MYIYIYIYIFDIFDILYIYVYQNLFKEEEKKQQYGFERYKSLRT